MLHADLDLSIMIKKLNKTNLLEHAINRQAAFRMAGLRSVVNFASRSLDLLSNPFSYIRGVRITSLSRYSQFISGFFLHIWIYLQFIEKNKIKIIIIIKNNAANMPIYLELRRPNRISGLDN